MIGVVIALSLIAAHYVPPASPHGALDDAIGRSIFFFLSVWLTLGVFLNLFDPRPE